MNASASTTFQSGKIFIKNVPDPDMLTLAASVDISSMAVGEEIKWERRLPQEPICFYLRTKDQAVVQLICDWNDNRQRLSHDQATRSTKISNEV